MCSMAPKGGAIYLTPTTLSKAVLFFIKWSRTFGHFFIFIDVRQENVTIPLLMSDHCESLIIHCLDWRLQSGLEQWLKDFGIINGKFDRVAVAGAVKSLISPSHGATRDFLLKQIEISYNLHHIKQVILINHTDCGAYGGSKAFAGEQTELDLHKQELLKAAGIITNKFPTLACDLYIALLMAVGDDWQVKMEKIE